MPAIFFTKKKAVLATRGVHEENAINRGKSPSRVRYRPSCADIDIVFADTKRAATYLVSVYKTDLL
jgi:hypothetical protein